MPEPSLAGSRILVVEDEYMMADDLRQALEDQDAVVLGPVAFVEDALAIVESGEAIDAAVLDINLGGEKSFPVADALVARQIPILFATGYSDRDIPARYAEIGRVGKPVEPRDILRELGKELAAD